MSQLTRPFLSLGGTSLCGVAVDVVAEEEEDADAESSDEDAEGFFFGEGPKEISSEGIMMRHPVNWCPRYALILPGVLTFCGSFSNVFSLVRVQRENPGTVERRG